VGQSVLDAASLMVVDKREQTNTLGEMQYATPAQQAVRPPPPPPHCLNLKTEAPILFVNLV
jgi:hypothetical protein